MEQETLALKRSCVDFPTGFVGFPCIAPLDRDNCIITDWSGHIAVFNLTSRKVLARTYVGVEALSACQNLQSLCVEPSESKTAAVATRGGYAVVYDSERHDFQRIHPEQGGTVNSVAFAPEGKLLAIGTGSYALSGSQQPAMVELWSLEGETPKCLGFVALPGVCVDAMTWDDYGQEIAVATGLRSQDRGFVARLDASDLRPLAFAETPWAMSRRLAFVDGGGDSGDLVIAHNGTIQLLDRQDGSEGWKVESGATFADFAHDPDENLVVLTNGAVLDASDGSATDQLKSMTDCTSVAVRPGGGYLGASREGKLCWWG